MISLRPIELPRVSANLSPSRPHFKTDVGRSAVLVSDRLQRLRLLQTQEQFLDASDAARELEEENKVKAAEDFKQTTLLLLALKEDQENHSRFHESKRGQYSNCQAVPRSRSRRGSNSTEGLAVSRPTKSKARPDETPTSFVEKFSLQSSKYAEHISECKELLNEMGTTALEKERALQNLLDTDRDNERCEAARLKRNQGSEHIQNLQMQESRLYVGLLEEKYYADTLQLLLRRATTLRHETDMKVRDLQSEIDAHCRDCAVLQKEANLAKASQIEMQKAETEFRRQVAQRSMDLDAHVRPRRLLCQFMTEQRRAVESQRRAHEQQRLAYIQAQALADATVGKQAIEKLEKKLVTLEEGFAKLRSVFGYEEPKMLLRNFYEKQKAIVTMRAEVEAAQDRISSAKARRDELLTIAMEYRDAPLHQTHDEVNMTDVDVQISQRRHQLRERKGLLEAATKQLRTQEQAILSTNQMLVAVVKRLEAVDPESQKTVDTAAVEAIAATEEAIVTSPVPRRHGVVGSASGLRSASPGGGDGSGGGLEPAGSDRLRFRRGDVGAGSRHDSLLHGKGRRRAKPSTTQKARHNSVSSPEPAVETLLSPRVDVRDGLEAAASDVGMHMQKLESIICRIIPIIDAVDVRELKKLNEEVIREKRRNALLRADELTNGMGGASKSVSSHGAGPQYLNGSSPSAAQSGRNPSKKPSDRDHNIVTSPVLKMMKTMLSSRQLSLQTMGKQMVAGPLAQAFSQELLGSEEVETDISEEDDELEPVIDEDLSGEIPLDRMEVKKKAVRTVKKQVRSLQHQAGHQEAAKLSKALRNMTL